MKEIVSRILEKIGEKSTAVFLDSQKHEIKDENFIQIKDSTKNKSVSFVDGGNLELIKSPSFSVFFNRIYYSTYRLNKRVKSKRIEFYTFIYATVSDKKIIYNAECFGNDMKFSFDSDDRTIASSLARADISLIGNVIRRFSELKLASEIESDYIIIDGSLEKKYTNEERFLEMLKNRNVFGLSKSNDILTEKGSSAGAAVFLSKKDCFAYKICNNNYFLKLHDKSKYVFRLESSNDKEINEIASLLKENSKDIIFPGYPYGLIEADKFARVTENERKSLKMQMLIMLGDKITPYINNSNAHDLF